MKIELRGIGVKTYHLRIFYSLFLVLLMCIFWPELSKAYASSHGFAIKDVGIDRTTLSPGEAVGISFRLTKDAKVDILIYDPDYEAVRTLLSGQHRPAGTNTISWDGRNDLGVFVPDEAYLFTIVAEGDNGEQSKYDPTAHSGGERLNLRIDRIERSSGYYVLHYSVPKSCRVSIRAGVHKGPLLKTILDWKPMPPGEYTETWDGMDEIGRIRVMDEPGSILYIRGFNLPQNAIIVQESGLDYNVYKESMPPKAAVSRQSINYASVRRSAIKRMDKGISPNYLVQRAFNKAPRFTVCLSEYKSRKLTQEATVIAAEEPGLAESTITDVSGEISLRMEVAPESAETFNESRYEIVVFVDNKRFDEEESAYTPYTYTLDTRTLPNGERSITINLVSLTGQIGSYSFKINVNN